MNAADPTERLRAICAEVGFDLGRVEASVLDRLRLLAQHSETVSDMERMAASAQALFRHYQEMKPTEAFSAPERAIVVLGCLLSDVGKTGPRCADAAARRLIVDMFSIEGVRDETQPVARFLTTHFPADAERRIARFAALGLDPEMPMRQFWNLHAGWTLEILENGGVPAEAVAAAATHHLLDDINPRAIVGPDGRFTTSFGDNEAFDRAEKLVVVLDKYDALRRRGRLTHHAAIAWLRALVDKNPRFAGDCQLETLISDLDAVVRTGDGAVFH